MQSTKQNYNQDDQFRLQQQQSNQQMYNNDNISIMQQDDRYYTKDTKTNISNNASDIMKEEGIELQHDMSNNIDYVDQELLESFAESLSSMDYTTLCIMNHKSREDNNYDYLNTKNNHHHLNINDVTMNDLQLLSAQDLLDPSTDNFPLMFPGIEYIYYQTFMHSCIYDHYKMTIYTVVETSDSDIYYPSSR